MEPFMSFLRIFFKSLLFVTGILCYLLISSSIVVLSGFNWKRARPLLTKLVSVTSRLGLVIFNVKVIANFSPLKSGRSYLIVANHLSYLDILIISSSFPACFVTSHEMKETPVLGQLCLLGGCLFVERRKRSGIANEVKALSDALASGLSVAIFPEATSTNGEKVIPFRRPLFQAAIHSGVEVLPMCLNYRNLDGEKLTLKNRDNVFWYGSMSFFSHAFNLFSHKEVVAELSVMDTVNPSSFENKNDLADACHVIVSSEYQCIT